MYRYEPAYFRIPINGIMTEALLKLQRVIKGEASSFRVAVDFSQAKLVLNPYSAC